MGQRLLVLGVVGVLLTLTLMGTALESLFDVSNVNDELTRVSRALNHHKTADEMHDALRADVARAQLAGAGNLALSPQSVRADTDRHAARFRAALVALDKVDLPKSLETALSSLRADQDIYIVTAEKLVRSALSPDGLTPFAQTDYDAAFKSLAPEQRRVTRQLMATTMQAQAAAVIQREQAERAIAITAVAALGGWLALALWQHRSMRHLQAALVREADQRAAADLLQQSLLPHHLPDVPGARLAARSVPGNAKNRVGGDWYDAVALPTGEVLLVIGDVVGHDLPAAMVMGQLRNSLRAYAVEDPSPRTVLARANHAAHVLQTSDLATCVCVALSPRTMTMTWASAGHPPPLVAPRDGRRHLLTGEPGPPLGATSSAEYPEFRVQLDPGDSLLLYSDGLVERRGVPIDIGLSALETVPMPDDDPDTICAHLIELMVDGGANPDDVTCLVLQVQTQPSGAVGDLAPSPAGSPAAGPARATERGS
jgi:serine phosphatase RsbU (regulator of sigma subunit)